VSQKKCHFYFYDNFGKHVPIFIMIIIIIIIIILLCFFPVKFRKDLQKKLESKLSPPFKSVVTLVTL